MIHLPLVLNNGKISQLPIGDSISGSVPIPDSLKLNYHLSEMAAYDRVAAITYHDSGLKTQRINTITLTSIAFPDADIVKTVYYLDTGLKTQRIDRVEYTGAIFLPDSLRKVFVYSLIGTKYRIDGHYYEYF